MVFHSKLLANHVIHDFIFNDETARLAATGFVETDIGRVARQLDDDSFHVLTNAIAPAWTELTGGVTLADDLLGPTVKLDQDVAPGQLLAITGFDIPSGFPKADFADSDRSISLHPAIGVATLPALANDIVKLGLTGEIVNLDTDAFEVGDRLYLTTAGAFSNVSPTNWSQDIGYVTKKDLFLGRVFFDLSTRTEILIDNLSVDMGSRTILGSL